MPKFEDKFVYRVYDDSKRLATNRELAMWLSKGNGEICMYSDITLTYHQYEQDDELVTDILVRKWCDDSWHKPTRQYLGLGD